MENKIKKCSNLEHNEINANSFCSKCEIYMCNKCENIHSKLFNKHQSFILDKDTNLIFAGFCKEENHQMELQFFCKTHNHLCCALCLCKIKKGSMGKHHDCDVCNIEDIKDEKINKLKDNIQCLQKLSDSFEESINKLKGIFENINIKKEELKLKIQKIFTRLRNELNNREDELLYEIDNEFDKAYFKEEIIKESEKLYNKVKLSLENSKSLDKNYNDNNKITILINECINIENNIKGIEKINENIKKCKNSDDLKLSISLDKEDEINSFINKIKSFGKIYNSNSFLNVSYKWSKNQINNNFELSNNDRTMKINYNSCYNAYFLDYIFKDKLEYIICVSINTFGENLDYIYIGFMNENEEISSQKICLCEIPENCFYIRADEETIYKEKSTIKTVIENKTNLNLKFILNLKSKTLNIQNYDSNISYGTINITGNIFKFFVGKCCGTGGTIEYSLIPF